MNQIESLAQNENSIDDNDSTIMGPPVDRSYSVQDTSVSEVEVSFVNPTYSPIRFSDDECASLQQSEEVNSTSCCAMKISDYATSSKPCQ